MRGGLIGGVCFLAFLLSSGIKGQNLLDSYDLQQDGHSGNMEYKSADAQYEDEDQPRVSPQFATADDTVEADESSPALGQYKSPLMESDVKTDASADSIENKLEDLASKTSYEPESDDTSRLSANAFAGATSRVISQSDYIVPHLILGGENLIVCSRESELHNLWSPVYQCLVCVCVRDGWALQAVCVSCNLCLNPPPINNREKKLPQPLPPILQPYEPWSPPFPPPQPPIIPPLPPLISPEQPPFPPPQPPIIPPLPPLISPEQPPFPPIIPPLPPLISPEQPPFPPIIPPLPPLISPEQPPYPLPPSPPIVPWIPPQRPPYPPPLPPPPPPLPPLPPIPPPYPSPPEFNVPPVPPLQPESQVSCSPLPMDTLFQNPLNPCQLCVCTRIYDVYGQPEIKIQCQENPQCLPPPDNLPILPLPDNIIIPPPDNLPIPPIPMPPQPPPLPLALCERFQPNVPFSHPADRCKICMCVFEIVYFTPKQKIICKIKPECDNTIGPVPNLPDQLVPYPDGNIDSLPNIHPEPEPMPWPPKHRPSTPPSPLPGPPPHETCKPYPPNTPFQHPWDECQICMCSETYGRNVVNIEVNCYTKKSCCIEPPLSENIVQPLPLPVFRNNTLLLNQANDDIIFIEPRCRYQQPQIPFVADCNLCICQMVYSYVFAQCSPQPNCGSYPYPSIGGNTDASAQAFAGAYSQDYSLNNQPGLYGFSDSQSLSPQYPYDISIPGVPTGVPDFNSLNNLYAPGSLSSQLTQSEATAISQSGNSYPYPNYLYSPDLSQASVSAQANAESLSNQPSYLSSNLPTIGNSVSSAQAQAEAIANTQFGITAPLSQFPYTLEGNGLSGALADAEAYANTQYAGLNSPYNTFSNPLRVNSLSQYENNPYSLSQAEASASAESVVPLYGLNQNYLGGNGLISQQLQGNAQANAPYDTYDGYPSFLGSINYNDASASAQAEAIANAQSGGLLSQYNTNPYYLDGSQSDSSALSDAVLNTITDNSYTSGPYGYPYLTNQVNDQLGTLWSDSSAQAQALAQGGSATAQSLAQSAAISGRPLIRSGPGLCKYNGDKYHHNCQACYCFQEDFGSLYTLCLGNPCA